ncbi:hypothetical protein NQ318_021591 [Aromia moschata]|uniref:DNA polymerase n=1 Tax=Aromia moschata TaxID=1265417 RepID=A0AAV8YKR5_9CUCU|nr:hypothetical protein NQ318_021591 [Aromia moschata]
MGKRKATVEGNPNHDFCEFLTELAEYEKNVNRNIHKYNVYRKASSVLATHPTRVKSGDEAKKLQGIGEKISKKIDEFLQTRKLLKLENIHSDSTNAAINTLTRVSGIGPSKAHSLVKEGIMTIEDLKKHTDKLTHHQIIGLKYFEDFEKKIPRAEIEEIEKVINKELHSLDPDYKVTICGSYRRGKAESGDIDTLITHPSLTSDKVDKKHKNHMLKNIVSTLEKCGLITETLSLGRYQGACKLDVDHPHKEAGYKVNASRPVLLLHTLFYRFRCV